MRNVEDTYTNIPTIFEIKIREQGWIHDVNLHLSTECEPLPAQWKGYIRYRNGHRSSIFKLKYVFKNALANQHATFHYFIEGVEYVCEPMFFNVYPFYEA